MLSSVELPGQLKIKGNSVSDIETELRYVSMHPMGELVKILKTDVTTKPKWV